MLPLRIACTKVEIKILEVDFRSYGCPRCGRAAPRHDVAVRHAIDVGLEQVTILQIHVGVYKCPTCRRGKRTFRTPLDFLGPRRRFTARCRQKLVASIDEDQMSLNRTVPRLVRDFGVRISRSTAWEWHREAVPTAAAEADYKQLVAATFSGVLSVDEVYDAQYAILCARDPVNDRTLAYELGTKMNQEVVTTFFRQLADRGIHPKVAITDDSPLYPAALKAVWPAIRHQLCRFHWTKNLVKDVNKGVRAYRETLPKPPKRAKRGRPAKAEAETQQQATAAQTHRDEVHKGRTLLVCRPENVKTDAQKERLASLLAHHPALGVVREFMTAFYGIFDGKPRPNVAKARRQAILDNKTYAASPILTDALKRLKDEETFDKVSLYLHFENLDSTSDDVERDNRGFRQHQKIRYRVRSEEGLRRLLRRRLIRAGPVAKPRRLRRRVGRPSGVMTRLP